MDTTDKEPKDGSSNERSVTDPLPPLVAYQIEGESREYAAVHSGGLLEAYRHGRVEAEAHRISEEVTKEAQSRLRRSAPQVHSQQSEKDAFHEAGNDEVTAPKPPVTSAFTGEQTLPAPKFVTRLLVPLDGTPEAERTLPYASTLARVLHARLILGHVTPIADANKLAQALHVAGSDRLTAQQAFEPQVLPYLQDLRWRLSVPPDQVETRHISAPSVVEGLLELVAADDIGLVAVSLRSHPGADHFRLGKVVDSLIRECATPVLLVPPDVTANGSLFTLRHILVPLDGSALSEEALAPLLGFLNQTKGSAQQPLAVTLLRVAENRSKVPECWSYLEALRSVLMDMPVCSRVQVSAEAIIGSAPGAIVGRIECSTQREDDASAGGTCATEPADLLIMATHGRGGLGRLVLGSVAGYVLPRVRVPVLLVHPAYLTR
jgi:nucleotide-binding universal stress UspA family protein